LGHIKTCLGDRGQQTVLRGWCPMTQGVIEATGLSRVTRRVVPEVVLTWGWHRLVPDEVTRDMKARLLARPTRGFTELEVGHIYYRGPRYQGGGDDVWEVLRGVPSRRQWVVRRPSGGDEFRVYLGDYRGATFVDLDADLVSVLGVTAREAVIEAVVCGLEVPPRVRCCHPGVFVAIPERFRTGTGDWGSPEQRVKDCLRPCSRWESAHPGPTGVVRVHAWIDEAHRDIEALTCGRTRSAVDNPPLVPDYDRRIKDAWGNIEFYRWLEPLVGPAGVFFVEAEDVPG
jgi:hypothetical protein